MANYLVLPANGTGAGVLVLHAWWGLNDTFRRFCDRLAGEGLVALAPDLYNGVVAVTREDAKRLMRQMDKDAARWAALGGTGRKVRSGASMRTSPTGVPTICTKPRPKSPRLMPWWGWRI
jgi:dienelactone hydrolase